MVLPGVAILTSNYEYPHPFILRDTTIFVVLQKIFKNLNLKRVLSGIPNHVSKYLQLKSLLFSRCDVFCDFFINLQKNLI